MKLVLLASTAIALSCPSFAMEPTAGADPTQCAAEFDPVKTLDISEYAGDQVTLLFGQNEHLVSEVVSNKGSLEVVTSDGSNEVILKTKGNNTWTLRPFQVSIRMSVEDNPVPHDYQIRYTSLKPIMPTEQAAPVQLAAADKDAADGEAAEAQKKKDAEKKPVQTCYVIRYLHTAEDKAAQVAKQRAAWQQAQHIKVEQNLRREQMNPTNVNVNYTFQGDREIGPHGNPNGVTITERPDLWDDGMSTLLHFPGNQKIPVFFTIDDKGNDGEAINVVPEDNGIIKLPGVYKAIRLRTQEGTKDKTLCIFNKNVQDHNPQTGTPSASIGRGLKASK